jgi:hypothetical protein
MKRMSLYKCIEIYFWFKCDWNYNGVDTKKFMKAELLRQFWLICVYVRIIYQPDETN